jgi:hypothetical protein
VYVIKMNKPQIKSVNFLSYSQFVTVERA